MKTAIINEEQIINRLKKLSPDVPVAAVVLGSGVDVLADLTSTNSYSFEEIFGIKPTVEGHSGSISLGKLEGKSIAVLHGRFHLYEGHNLDVVTLPTRVLAAWGVPNLYLTNAAGAINPIYVVGDLMLITGFRNFLSPGWKETGMLPALRMPPVNCQNELSAHIWQVAERLAQEDQNFRLPQRGVYVGVLGPNYETLAEVEMFKKLHTDAVGMSTIPELEAASKTKMQAAAISVITNSWSQTNFHGHKEVLEAAKAASQRLDKLIRAAILS